MAVKLSFELEPITPLFCAGPDPTKPEIRPPSIRGALRFWFRAMLGGVLGGDPDAMWRAVRDRESRIFGAADYPSPIDVIVRDTPKHWQPFDFRQWEIRYLGYGLDRTRNTPARGYFPPARESRFRLQVRTRGPVAVVTATLWLLLTLGGIGARSRRGFGALQVVSDEGLPQEWRALFYPPKCSTDWPKHLKMGLKHVQATFAEYAGSTHPVVGEPLFDVIAPPDYWGLWLSPSPPGPWNNWMSALIWAGGSLRRFREDRASGPHSRRIGARIITYYVNRDYSTLKGLFHPSSSSTPPSLRLPVFGLPVITQFQSLGTKLSIEGAEHDRRASPLVFRPLRSTDGSHVVTILLFRSQFLPGGEGLNVEELLFDGSRRPLASNVRPPGWSTIDAFIRSTGAKPVI